MKSFSPQNERRYMQAMTIVFSLYSCIFILYTLSGWHIRLLAEGKRYFVLAGLVLAASYIYRFFLTYKDAKAQGLLTIGIRKVTALAIVLSLAVAVTVMITVFQTDTK